MRAVVFAAVCVSVLGCGGSSPPPPAPKPAQTAAPNDAAQKHYDTGMKLLDAKTFVEALAAFDQAYKLGGRGEALFRVAQCQQALKHYALAYDAYEQALTKHESELTPDERVAARKALDEIATTTGAILVVVSEPDAEIEWENSKGSPTRSPMTKPRRVRSSTQQIRVTKPGFVPVELSVVVAAGDQKRVEVKLEQDKGGGAGAMSDADRKATARSAFTEGVALQEKGDCAGALPKLETAERLFDAPTHVLHIAQCEAATGKLVAAQEHLSSLAHAALPAGSPDAFQKAQDDAKALLPDVQSRVPTLRLTIEPRAASDLEIKVNGAKMANDLVGIARPLDPGTYRVIVSAKGFKTTSADIALAEKEAKAVELKLKK